MPRYRLTIEYDGTTYVGWQRQENGPSIQEGIEKAATLLDEMQVACAGAGRTDSGVHALGMVAHIDLQKNLAVDRVRDALNHYLRPQPISVLNVQQVSEDFHARFSCIRRYYLYRLTPRRAPPALDRLRVWQVPYELDVEAMQIAASHLVGQHDFTAFRSSQCQAQSPVKTLEAINVHTSGAEVHITCNAPSFLHNQVRSFVGTLERVGAGRWRPERVKEVLHSCDRQKCGPVAPAHGLYFMKADYSPSA